MPFREAQESSDQQQMPDCPNCKDSGRVGPGAICRFYCYECCENFDD